MQKRTLEVNGHVVQANDTLAADHGARIMITPPLNEDYWLFRVKLTENQSLGGFPKLGTIGIGFAQEKD